MKVLIFTFDDDKNTILRNLVAAKSLLPRNVVDRKHRDPTTAKARESSYLYLKNKMVDNKLAVFDYEEVPFFEDMIAKIYEERKKGDVAVFVDGLWNCNTKKDFKDTRHGHIFKAVSLQRCAIRNQCPIVCTAEVQHSAPRVGLKKEHIMESGKYVYCAQVIIMLYPSDPEDFDEKRSDRVVAYIDKNKNSSIKGRKFLQLKRDEGLFIEEEV